MKKANRTKSDTVQALYEKKNSAKPNVYLETTMAGLEGVCSLKDTEHSTEDYHGDMNAMCSRIESVSEPSY